MADPINTSQQVDLRTLRLAELSTIIEDINYNFSILRSHPMFQGIKGDPGTPGIKGSAGTRGSRWLFFFRNEFQQAFPSTDFSRFNTTDRYITWLNTQIRNNVTRPLVLETLSVSEFVDTDIVVLPNTAMIQYDGASQNFIDTGVQINAESGYVKKSDLDAAIEDVKKLINEDIEQVGIPSYLKSFVDGVDVPNNVANEYSYLDAVSGPNASVYDEHRFFGPNSNDTEISKANILTLLAGLKEWYHTLITNTLQAGNYASSFVPGPGRMPALVVMQNDTNSGLLIGPKATANNIGIDKYGRIFMGEGVTIDGISKKVIKDISKYGLHLFSNLTGSVTSSGHISEVFITPAAIYLISALVEVMKDMIIHGKLTVEGISTFNDVVSILKDLNVTNAITSKSLTTQTLKSNSIECSSLKITGSTQATSSKILVIDDAGNVHWDNLNTGGEGGGGLIDYGATESWESMSVEKSPDVSQKPRFTGKIPSASNLNTIITFIQHIYSYCVNRMYSIETKNSTQDSEISGLRNSIGTVNTDINSIKSKNSEQDRAIEQLKEDIKNIGDISSGNISSILERIGTIEDSISVLESRVTVNESEIVILRNRISTINSQITVLQEKNKSLESTITSLTNRILQIENGTKLDTRYVQLNPNSPNQTIKGTLTAKDFIANG